MKIPEKARILIRQAESKMKDADEIGFDLGSEEAKDRSEACALYLKAIIEMLTEEQGLLLVQPSIDFEYDMRKWEYWTGLKWQIISPETLTIRKRAYSLKQSE